MCSRLNRSYGDNGQRQLSCVQSTQWSFLNEVAPFSDRLAFVGRQFCRRRGSCPLYLGPSRAQTCRTRLFASWTIYCRLFRTSYYSPADGNDTNECVSTLSRKNVCVLNLAHFKHTRRIPATERSPKVTIALLFGCVYFATRAAETTVIKILIIASVIISLA